MPSILYLIKKINMAKIDFSQVTFPSTVDYSVDFYNWVKEKSIEVFEDAEKQLKNIEPEGIEITVILSGEVRKQPYMYGDLSYEIKPSDLSDKEQHEVKEVLKNDILLRFPPKQD